MQRVSQTQSPQAARRAALVWPAVTGIRRFSFVAEVKQAAGCHRRRSQHESVTLLWRDNPENSKAISCFGGARPDQDRVQAFPHPWRASMVTGGLIGPARPVGLQVFEQ